MKQAILIMMHREPEQALRLVKYFPPDKCVCFIHIDKKANFDINKFSERLKKENCNSVLIKERISATLANWTLAQVSVELIKAALQYEKECNIHFSYYRLLSGQDYPIRSFSEYEMFLEKGYPNNYLGIDLVENVKHVKDKFSRWRYWKIRNLLDCNIQNKNLRNIILFPVYVWEVFLTKFRGTPQRILEKWGYKVAGGPSWWNLSDDFIYYFIKRVEEDKKLISVIQNTATPEESLIQMVYVNSPFYDLKKFTWNLTIGKYTESGHTEYWKKEELKMLQESNCFFARKFSEDISGELLDALDNDIYLVKQE